MPQKIPSTVAAAGAAVLVLVLAAAYFFASGDAPSTAPPPRDASRPEDGSAASTDRRQVIAAALTSGHATCLEDLERYRVTAVAQIELASPPELERYVEPNLLAELGEAPYQRLNEHLKDLQGALVALRDATQVGRAPSVADGVGPPLASPSAPTPEAASPQDAEAKRAEIERVIESLRGTEYGGDLIKPQSTKESPVGPMPEAVEPQDDEALARVRREETERVIEELRRSAVGRSDNDLVAPTGADADVAKRKGELVVKMEAFCADILGVARDL